MSQNAVLVIDDERLLVKSTCMALKAYGFNAQGVTDGQEGIRIAEELGPRVILLDIMMPGIDGWEVLRRLKERAATREIPVIIFSAKEYPNGNTLAAENGAAGYIAKPFELEDLIEVLRKHIG